jgi:hypothetical protein
MLKSLENHRVTREHLSVPAISESLCLKARDAAPSDRDLIHYCKNALHAQSIVANRIQLRTWLLKCYLWYIQIDIGSCDYSLRGLYQTEARHQGLCTIQYSLLLPITAATTCWRWIASSVLHYEIFTPMKICICAMWWNTFRPICFFVSSRYASVQLKERAHTNVIQMQQTSGDSSCWVGYIVGIKRVIDAAKQIETPVGSDASLVLGWIFYFEVMARFSLRHWRTDQMKALVEELGFDTRIPGWCALQYVLARSSFARDVPNIAAHAHPVFQLLAEVSDTAMYSSEPKYLSAEYQLHLEDLRSRLEHVSSQPIGFGDSPQKELHHTQQFLELNRLAGLIYLERVSRSFSGQSCKMQTWVKQAVSILAKLETCLCPFALFIISCELDADEDRMLILNLYARVEKKPHLRSFLETRGLIQTAWNQQDLAGDEGLEYIYKVTLVISSRNVIPSLL